MDRKARELDVAELSNLSIRVGEIEEKKHCRSFVINVECKTQNWTVRRRYTDFRELREALCTLIVRSEHSCTERCHFLAGVQLDKFPRRILIHSRGALEARAIDLEAFLQKIVLRLNLCNKKELETCAAKGCAITALLAKFFRFPNYQSSDALTVKSRYLAKPSTTTTTTVPVPESFHHTLLNNTTRCIRTASIVS